MLEDCRQHNCHHRHLSWQTGFIGICIASLQPAQTIDSLLPGTGLHLMFKDVAEAVVGVAGPDHSPGNGPLSWLRDRLMDTDSLTSGHHSGGSPAVIWLLLRSNFSELELCAQAPGSGPAVQACKHG